MKGDFSLQVTLKLWGPAEAYVPHSEWYADCMLLFALKIENMKSGEWFIVGDKRLFQPLAYRELIKQDRETCQGSFPRKGELVLFCCIKRDGSYMAFVLPKSKHGSIRLYALWLPQDQNLAHPIYFCIPVFLFPTGWLSDSLFISLFTVSKLSLTPGLVSRMHLGALFLPQVIQCPLHPLPSEWSPWVSFHPAPLFFHRLIWTLGT